MGETTEKTFNLSNAYDHGTDATNGAITGAASYF